MVIALQAGVIYLFSHPAQSLRDTLLRELAPLGQFALSAGRFTVRKQINNPGLQRWRTAVFEFYLEYSEKWLTTKAGRMLRLPAPPDSDERSP